MDMHVLTQKDYRAAGLGHLGEIPDPPERLWMRGTLHAPEIKRLAVVGSRALTSYGREACQKLVGGLSGYPVSIVSGLALGADACAHTTALDAGLHTIAVPGSGLSERAIAPRTNIGLARRILEQGGALLSEHPPDEPGRVHHFPSRNRIMVGLSDAVLIIEAAEQSGTLITARLAADYNRDLLCVPHRIGDAHGFGAHLFIRMGAVLVSEPAHILETLGIPLRAEGTPITPPTLQPNEEALYRLLATPSTRDELIRTSGLPAGVAIPALVTLELKGLAKEEFGAWRRT